MSVLLVSGCETIGQYQVRPLVEMEHVSHALQHVDKDVTNWNCSPNCGYNLYSIGARWRPFSGFTVDLLEGYTKDQLHGQKEVFTGRITWEVGAQ
jgi:hypothetical protein